ncbi:hypothetical protein CPB85DRAFT_1256523 [Mucidula mucida]|nr:hypothetical protein CPB85DRAFT_1256523 [Mucidula mucida]
MTGESLDLGLVLNMHLIWATSFTMKAVQFDHKVSYQDGQDGDLQARVAFQSLGRALPNLYCLDMVINDFVEDKDNMMHSKGHAQQLCSYSLPNLGILILMICHGLLCSRPRRSDFPSDDGGDRRQHDYAIVFFRTCPSLDVISFNGVRFEDPPVFMQPDRVWRRVTVAGEVEAHMTGRESLPWTYGLSRKIDKSKLVWMG